MTVAHKEPTQNERRAMMLHQVKQMIARAMETGCYMVVAAGLDPNPVDNGEDGGIVVSPGLQTEVIRLALDACVEMAGVSREEFTAMANDAYRHSGVPDDDEAED